MDTLARILYSAVAVVPAFLLLWFTPIRVYYITDSQIRSKIAKYIRGTAAARLNGDNPQGMFIGRWYAGYIDSKDDNTVLIATEARYAEMTHDEFAGGVISQPVPPINIWERASCYGGYPWRRSFPGGMFTPRVAQRELIEDIRHSYTQKYRFCVLLYGAPGAGKSILGLMLAEAMGASLYRGFDPTDPGESLTTVYYRAEPTAAKPLVVTIEEVDTIFRRITTGTVRFLKNHRTLVHDKTTWNQFLDDVDSGFYPYMVVIMTSNKTPAQICEDYDESFIRRGRVHAEYRL